MGLSFLSSSEQTLEVVVTCDPSVECTDEERSQYLDSGDMLHLKIGDSATTFTLKAWHHQLSNDEREAMSEYQQYLNNVYNEMIRASLISINDVDATLEQLQMIRPESHRVQTISELVLHIQRISLLGDQGK